MPQPRRKTDSTDVDPVATSQDAPEDGAAHKSPVRSAVNGQSPTAKREWVVSSRPEYVIPEALADPLVALEDALDVPVWLLVHNGRDALLDWNVLQAFLDARDLMDSDEHVALVIDSPGGYADMAFRIARILCRHCDGFTAVIPRWAKSAATLLTLGASEVYMAKDAEIGPLDVQIYDEEREQRGSALDEIQALEQLHQVALMQLNQNVELMKQITRRRYDVVLPHATNMVAQMMAPMIDKIDTVHYAKQSRLLAVAEEYALRLMSARMGRNEARRIAERLVKGYPEHGFVIDRKEASAMIGIVDHSDVIEHQLRLIETYLYEHHEVTLFGRLKEKT